MLDKKKYIFVIIDGNIPSIKAHSITTVKMADALQSKFPEKEVVLITAGSFLNYLNFLKFIPFKKHYGIKNKIKIKFLNNFFKKSFYLKTIDFSWFESKLYSFLSDISNEVDFVYARSFTAPHVCLDLKIPVVMETHTSIIKNQKLIKLYERVKDASFLGIITIHEKLKKMHVNAGFKEEKILVAHDGFTDIDKEEESVKFKKIKRDGFYIATYVGSLYKEKGIEDILSMANSCKDKKIKFIFAGGTAKQVKKYKTIAKNLELKNVTFLGFVKNSKVRYLLKSSDVLLIPYPKLDNYQVMDIETTSPLKLFEYMSIGKPILSTDISVINSILSHNQNAYLAKVGDIDDLTNGLNRILENKAYAEELGKSAKELSDEYSWEKRVEKLSSFFLKRNYSL